MAETYGLLGTRVMQLEYKVKAMAQRERKATIWRAALESWILKTFNYDLKLEVQLKLLQSENESDDIESLEQNLNSSPNRVFMGQTSITKTRLSASPTTLTSSTRSSSSSSNTSSPSRQVSQNISITTMPAPPSFARQQSQGHGHPSPKNVQMHGTNMPRPRPGIQGTVRAGQVRPVEIQANKRPRFANNVGIVSQRQSQPLLNPNFAQFSRDMQTPIIVSTSSMAPRKPIGPVKSPELILLDDEEDETTRKPLHPTSSPVFTSSTSATTTTYSPSGIDTTNSSGVSLRVIDANSAGSKPSDSAVTNKTPTTNSYSSTNSLCPVGSASSINSSSIYSFGTSSNCTSVNCSYNSTAVNSSSFYASPYSSGSGIPNFGANTSSSNPAYISSSSDSNLSRNNDDNNSNVQNLELFVETLAQDNGVDSENSNGFDPSYQLINMLQLEAHYATNNYITRNEGNLLFNVQKIFLEYEPSLHTELLQLAPRLDNDLPMAYKKRMNANVCHFLMQVYGEKVPVVAKQAMAESLFDAFPVLNKDEWFKKMPHKNATGCIQNKLTSLRKHFRDQRKRVEEDPSLLLV